ncbi:MAG: hypothetical protein AAB573_02490 [Patescibacteria group bacterium]
MGRLDRFLRQEGDAHVTTREAAVRRDILTPLQEASKLIETDKTKRGETLSLSFAAGKNNFPNNPDDRDREPRKGFAKYRELALISGGGVVALGINFLTGGLVLKALSFLDFTLGLGAGLLLREFVKAGLLKSTLGFVIFSALTVSAVTTGAAALEALLLTVVATSVAGPLAIILSVAMCIGGYYLSKLLKSDKD